MVSTIIVFQTVVGPTYPKNKHLNFESWEIKATNCLHRTVTQICRERESTPSPMWGAYAPLERLSRYLEGPLPQRHHCYRETNHFLKIVSASVLLKYTLLSFVVTPWRLK